MCRHGWTPGQVFEMTLGDFTWAVDETVKYDRAIQDQIDKGT